jgi:hypothetical protein
MPTPKPDPKKPKKDKGPYKYKTETTVIKGSQKVLFGPITGSGDRFMTVKRAMSTPELVAEKKKAPKGTSVWTDPSIGFDGLKPRKSKKGGKK